MADSRTKNASRNIFFGVINKFVVLVLPFITRTLVLKLLGASFLGIGTLFTSILSFLSLSQLGLESAIVYIMYKPIAEKDEDRICAILNYYKKFYRIIGLVILFLGTVLVPFLPVLMNGEAPDGINAVILYYIYLTDSVISYFFSGYRRSLIIAHQRSDINSNVHTVVNLLVQFTKIFALYFTKNYYVYAFVPIVGTLIINTTTAIITKKMYPQYFCRGEIDSDTKQQIRKKLTGLFGTKLNSIVIHSADVIVVSAFLGLSMTAKYGNYYYIMNAVCGFVAILFSSLIAGIGNKLVTDSIDENYKLFKNIGFMNSWIIGLCSVFFLCLYEPFMLLWVGKDMQLGIGFVVLFVLYFFIYEIQKTVLSFKDAMGLWNKDKVRPYVSMTVNLGLNLILINFIGIYGIVASTIISFLISLPWVNNILYKNGFPGKRPSENLFRIISDFFISLVACILTYIPCKLLGNGYFALFVRVALCLVIPNFVFFICYRRRPEFNFFIGRLRKIIKSRF